MSSIFNFSSIRLQLALYESRCPGQKDEQEKRNKTKNSNICVNQKLKAAQKNTKSCKCGPHG